MAKELALTSAKVRPHVEGREIRKSVYVPGRLVNFVVS
jgi:leucyl-tRNA synthetase